MAPAQNLQFNTWLGIRLRSPFSGLAFWFQLPFLPEPNCANRAAYNLGEAKSGAI
jgi:hypothetical protein